jgi:hypothetical protein
MSRAPSQVVVTEAMIATHGPFIWEHSNNVQTRHGDPVRLLDLNLARKDRGMTDQEMAETLGLEREQVRQIRVMLEARNYNRRHYSRLYDLGGNRRYRGEIKAADTRDPAGKRSSAVPEK